MRLSEELKMMRDCGDSGYAFEGLEGKAKALEDAFERLINLAGECDSWESFPSEALNEAYYSIENPVDNKGG